jgi:hypothetical protein
VCSILKPVTVTVMLEKPGQRLKTMKLCSLKMPHKGDVLWFEPDTLSNFTSKDVNQSEVKLSNIPEVGCPGM